ncbi:acetyltransferase, GNAT family [Clostridiales bacterium oral taxon 876 str. F0540]|nr:acetyltransferase, GNAT family [Clostridiales bacterium oral taxon 876 str. F0540]
MITYKNCLEVEKSLIYEAFKIGFSDYIIKMEVPEDFFFKRFFGPEGNNLETSFIALDEDKPIGVILGAIKTYEGIKTIRCGTLAVHPEYRGKGVSKNLHDLHKAAAIKAGCRQLFLEVIVGNDRAINFYKKNGYEKIYDLSYYSLTDLNKLSFKENHDIIIKEIPFEELEKAFENLKDTHINWQNDLDYLKKSEGQLSFGAYKNNILIGAISLNKSSKVSFIWVSPEFRNNGIGTDLILKGVDELKLEKLSISFPNNASLQGYVNHKGFTRDIISQYEMYYTL